MTRVPVETPRGRVGRGAQPCRDADVIAGYLRDASGRIGSAEALFRPENEAEIAAVLRSAHGGDVPVTVVAGQTSTTASSVPQGGWILSTEKLARMGSADGEARRARCQAGAILGAWQDRLLGQGFLYPPDPTSRYECTVGGSLACNASGPRSHRFGATRRWIRGLRVVLTCGEVLALQRGDCVADRGGGFEVAHSDDPEACAFAAGGGPRAARVPVPGFSHGGGIKNAAGYFGGREVDLVDLFIGAEGTLGVVSEVEVDLVPRPAGCLDLFVCFADESAALDLVERAREAGRSGAEVRPDSLEWFDRSALDLIASDMPAFEIPQRAQVAVFVEQLTQTDEPPLDAWFSLLQACGADLDSPAGVRVAQTDAQRETLRRARHAVPAGVNERAARNGMPKLGTDLSVPDDRLRSVVALYRRAAEEPRSLLARAAQSGARRAADLPSRLETVTFGHVGDNHLHVNFLPANPRELDLAQRVYAELTRRVIAWGGSPSAEHGIGKLKHAALRQFAGEAGLAEMLGVKRALDPRGVLGRGNLFDWPWPA